MEEQTKLEGLVALPKIVAALDDGNKACVFAYASALYNLQLQSAETWERIMKGTGAPMPRECNTPFAMAEELNAGIIDLDRLAAVCGTLASIAESALFHMERTQNALDRFAGMEE